MKYSGERPLDYQDIINCLRDPDWNDIEGDDETLLDDAADAIEKSLRIKDILGNNCDLDRLCELVQADKEGALLVIGSKIEEAVYTPPADVAPIVHGRWIEVGFEAQDVFGKLPPVKVVRGYRCNVCNRFEREKEPYCHCGAKMDLMEDA